LSSNKSPKNENSVIIYLYINYVPLIILKNVSFHTMKIKGVQNNMFGPRWFSLHGHTHMKHTWCTHVKL